MNLYIDSTNNLKTIIKLGEHELVKIYDSPREQNVLAVVDEALKKHNLPLKDISSITVNPGPGSFTGTRVGVAIANSLAFGLNLKVNGQNPPIEPSYDRPPNITTRQVEPRGKIV